jgi:hypothetical protein
LRVIDALETYKRNGHILSSAGKKKTTMAKLTRESRLRERRLEKQARKHARKQAAAHPPAQPNDPSTAGQEQTGPNATPAIAASDIELGRG